MNAGEGKGINSKAGFLKYSLTGSS